MFKLKKVTGLLIALVMAITFMAQPLVVLADTYGEPDNAYEYYDYTEADDYDYADLEDEYPVVEVDPVLAARLALFEILYDALYDMLPGGLRFIQLTSGAREIALYDFDLFAEYMLATVPTRNMFGRQFDISLEDYLDSLRRMIYDNVPVLSLTVLEMGERWASEPTDDLMIAADYMFSLLLLFALETGGFGHFVPQGLFLVEHTFFAVAYALYHGIYLDDEIIQALEELGIDVDWLITSNYDFSRFHYDVFNTPSVLWFYDIDPTLFDFDVDLMEQVGTMNEDNITTQIIEPGEIAYFHIASFMNNMYMDSEVLFPFFEEVQDFAHLIIDIRGNGGGMVGYFPALIVSMLIDDIIYFTYPEFFVANERTAGLLQNPMSLASANLYGIFPAAEFVQSQGMAQFNRDDLALLDYAIVWSAAYFPSEYAIPFGGEIWLLVDEFSASASVMAAQLAVNTGFATVVGEPTSRVTGVIYTHFPLPNTGILFRLDLGYTTDQYGRSIEEFGVIPQVANFAGMDALETVLAIIRGEDGSGSGVADIPTLHTTMIDGVGFVRLRDLATYLLSADVEWDGPSQTVTVIMPDGTSFMVVVSAHGVVNIDGTVFVPVASIEYVLAELMQY